MCPRFPRRIYCKLYKVTLFLRMVQRSRVIMITIECAVDGGYALNLLEIMLK